MIVQNTFPFQRIKLDMESEFRDEAFEELVDLLVKDFRASGAVGSLGSIKIPGEVRATVDRSAMLEALERRESKMSTGIKKGLAIPHATIPGLPRFTGVLGISKKGIDYGSLDGFPVYIVFLLLSPPEDSEAHLQALKRIAMLMDDDESISSLQKSVSPAQAYSILKTFDEIK